MAKRPASPGHSANEKRQRRLENERKQIEETGDEVEIASDDSFPASDPPSYTPVKGEKEDVRPLKRRT